MDSPQRKPKVITGSQRSTVGQALGFATIMAVSCLITYWTITSALAHAYFVSRHEELMGGMWAVVATIFVFRESMSASARAALSRMLATLLSFVLCFLYLLVFPVHLVGMLVLIWVSSAILPLVGRSDDVLTTGITTAVVLVVAALSPGPAWVQPILRLVDTAVGITVGLLSYWVGTVVGPARTLQSNDSENQTNGS